MKSICVQFRSLIPVKVQVFNQAVMSTAMSTGVVPYQQRIERITIEGSRRREPVSILM